MDEKAFQRMLDHAHDRRQREVELAQERARRRETLLTRAIQTNRVRMDRTPVDENSPEVRNPRAHFEQSLAKLLRQQAEPSSDELEKLLGDG